MEEPRPCPSRTDSPPTDDQGLSRLEHVQRIAPTDSLLQSASLAPVLLGGPAPSTPVDLHDLTGEPIDVVLPPFGIMEVMLLGPDGRPWMDPGGALGEMRNTADGQNSSSFELGEDGIVVLQPVVCGEEFRVRVRGLTTIVQGPAVQGERVRAELRMGEDTPILAGRLVDDQLMPVSGSFALELRSSRGLTRADVVTDHTGRFQTAPDARALEETITIIVRETRISEPARTALHQMPTPIHRGINELGDLVLRVAPVLVAGRVELRDGTPVEYPEFVVEYAQERPPGNPSLRLGPQEPGPAWNEHFNLRPERSADGSFVVHAFPVTEQYRLRIDQQGLAPLPPIEFRIGAEDLVIRVARAGMVEAIVLGDPAALRELEFRLGLQVPPVGEDPMARTFRESREATNPRVQDELATCVWNGLTPGTYRLTITIPGMPPVVTLDSIAVPEGGAAEDPRLLDIDLRDRLRRVTVTMLDPSGTVVPVGRRGHPAGVMVRGDPGAEWHGRALDGEDGHLELTLSSPRELIAFAPGYRTQEMPGVFADTTVRLEPALPLRLQLSDALPEVPAGTAVQLMAEPSRPQGYRSTRGVLAGGPAGAGLTVDSLLGRSGQRLPADDAGEFLLDTRGGGVLNLHLELTRVAGGSLRRGTVAVLPAELDTDALAPGQVVRLRLDPESLKTALEELGK